jgi:hypothetical protein
MKTRRPQHETLHVINIILIIDHLLFLYKSLKGPAQSQSYTFTYIHSLKKIKIIIKRNKTTKEKNKTEP